MLTINLDGSAFSNRVASVWAATHGTLYYDGATVYSNRATEQWSGESCSDDGFRSSSGVSYMEDGIGEPIPADEIPAECLEAIRHIWDHQQWLEAHPEEAARLEAERRAAERRMAEDVTICGTTQSRRLWHKWGGPARRAPSADDLEVIRAEGLKVRRSVNGYGTPSWYIQPSV